jgi:integral membrane protein
MKIGILFLIHPRATFAAMKIIFGKDALKQFIVISRLEGISFLLLVFIAMPLKYGAGMPLMVKYVGWAHGVLFMAYVAQLLFVAISLKWDIIKTMLGFIASLLPFGPFVFERRLIAK